MKKLSILIAVLYTTVLTGCLKDTPNTDFSQTFPTVEIMYSGMQFFSASSPQGQSYALNFNKSVITYDLIVNLNSTYPLNKDLNVTLAVNDAARTAYNSANGTNYQPMPASIYSFPTTQGTIKSGTRQVHFALTFDSTKFKENTDPTQSYMVPITLTDASGTVIASNFQTIYPHSIGNVLAGVYNWTYNRWNKEDTTGTPNTVGSGEFTFVPDDPSTVEVQSGYGNQNNFNYRYKIHFDGGTNGTPISNVTVTMNAADVKSVSDANGINLAVPAKVVFADIANKHFKFTYGVLNSAPAARTFTDEYWFK